MRYRRYMCQGDPCQQPWKFGKPGDAVKGSISFVDLPDLDKDIPLPPGWLSVDRKLMCPRCVAYHLDGKLDLEGGDAE